MHVRSISARQAQSLSKRSSDVEQRRIGHAGFIKKFSPDIGTFKICQWIEGEPTRSEIRIHGSDKFKCGAAVKPSSSFCEEHHKICFKPLTETDS